MPSNCGPKASEIVEERLANLRREKAELEKNGYAHDLQLTHYHAAVVRNIERSEEELRFHLERGQ